MAIQELGKAKGNIVREYLKDAPYRHACIVTKSTVMVFALSALRVVKAVKDVVIRVIAMSSVSTRFIYADIGYP